MPMVTSPAAVVATLLVQNGVGAWYEGAGQRPDWAVYYHEAPEPANVVQRVVLVRDAGGVPQTRQMRGPWTDYPTVQFLVRAVTDDEAQAKAKQVCDLLDGVYMAPVVLDTVLYYVVHLSRKDQPTFLKQQDRQNLRDHVFNASVRVTT